MLLPIDVGKLSEPVTRLIDRISDAVGGVAKPGHTRRMAKAEGDALIEQAKAQLEVERLWAAGKMHISDIEHRGMLRRIRQDGIQQRAIEGITVKSIPHITVDAKVDEVETDWISFLFDKGKLVNDSEMQELWAKILAGEANRPGSFSKKTIEIVSWLSKDDAHLFTKFCSCIWTLDRHYSVFPFSLLDNWGAGVSYENISHLDDLGLVKLASDNICAIQFAEEDIFDGIVQMDYFGITLELRSDWKSSRDINCGAVALTRAGEELASIAGATRNLDYLQKAIEHVASYDEVCISTPLNGKKNWNASM